MPIETHLIKALPLSYRNAEIEEIARRLRAGDSCSVVGVSGMAKSNLFRHLVQPEVHHHYMGDDWRNYLPIAVDCHGLGKITADVTMAFLLERLIIALQQHGIGEEIISTVEQLRGDAVNSKDPRSWQQALTGAIAAVMSDPNRHLFVLFDQFDEVYKTLDPQFFINLRSLRDEYKYRISYVVFTRDELPHLSEGLECEEFYELFSSGVLGLGPYNRQDALLLLDRVASRYGQRLAAKTSDQLIELTGGHPGLLKAACLDTLDNNRIDPEECVLGVDSLLAIDGVHTECVKLWQSISGEEQNALHRLAAGSSAKLLNAELARRLRLKGLVLTQDSGVLPFCPLITTYARDRRTSRPPQTRISAGPIRIDTAGEVWVEGQQVVPSLSLKELMLLEYLCLEPGRLRTKDEIIAVVYPDEYRTGYTVSDDALGAIVKRLRSRIEHFSGGRNYVGTVRGKGYRLNVAD